MKIIVRPRQAGKTTELIKLASKEWLYIICPNQVQVRGVVEQAARLGMDIPFPMTWRELLDNNYYGKNINGFVIDNLDMCLQQMTYVPIAAVTLNGGKE